jgi:hypothetical protein
VRLIFPFSSIRTVTVGFGIAPNLLTPPIARRALAGFGNRSPLPPVGTFTPPREHGRIEIRPGEIKSPLARLCNDFPPGPPPHLADGEILDDTQKINYVYKFSLAASGAELLLLQAL